MLDLLQAIAADDSQRVFYRQAARELIAAWQGTSPQIVVGQERPMPVIVATDDLLGHAEPAPQPRQAQPQPMQSWPTQVGVPLSRKVTKLCAAIKHVITAEGIDTANEIAERLSLTRAQVCYALEQGPFYRVGRQGRAQRWAVQGENPPPGP
jgi:hypothetical protein